MHLENTDDEWGNKVTLDEEEEYVEVKEYVWIRVKDFAVLVIASETGITTDVYNAFTFSEEALPISSLQLYDS